MKLYRFASIGEFFESKVVSDVIVGKDESAINTAHVRQLEKIKLLVVVSCPLWNVNPKVGPIQKIQASFKHIAYVYAGAYAGASGGRAPPQSTNRKKFKRIDTEMYKKQRNFVQFLSIFRPIFVIFWPKIFLRESLQFQNAGMIANKF